MQERHVAFNIKEFNIYIYTHVEPDRQETSPITDTHSFSYNLVPNPRGTART
jgi:hypothetical protein